MGILSVGIFQKNINNNNNTDACIPMPSPPLLPQHTNRRPDQEKGKREIEGRGSLQQIIWNAVPEP
jgi:hypothetical protein